MRTLIKNGTIVDPGSQIHSRRNLLIEDGRVLAVLREEEPEADEVLDAQGLIVAPGFIDIHMHEDPYDASEDRIASSIMNSMLRMGVTTAIGGNCGIHTMSPVRYLELMDRDGGPIHMGLLAGHTFFREEAGNHDKYRVIQPDEQRRLTRLVDEALEAGCFGVSFGIRYVPGITMREMVETAHACKGSGRLIAAHVRNDADQILDAAEELIGVGKTLEAPVQISHVGSMGGFGQMGSLLSLVDRYREEGMEVTGDCYPYYAFSTRIGETTYDDGFLERYRTDYSAIEICEGVYKGMRCTESIFHDLRQNAPETLTICHVMKPEDVDLALTHPAIMLASDGLMDRGQGHPRGAGAFPRLLYHYVSTGKMTLDDAIAKMTVMPAKKLGLSRKGTLCPGADADIVIFDLERVRDCATFEHPNTPPEGIEWVLLEGKIALEHGEIRQAGLGRAIRAR